MTFYAYNPLMGGDPNVKLMLVPCPQALHHPETCMPPRNLHHLMWCHQVSQQSDLGAMKTPCMRFQPVAPAYPQLLKAEVPLHTWPTSCHPSPPASPIPPYRHI